MPNITITLDDEMAQKVAGFAQERGLSVEELIVRTMRQRVHPKPGTQVPVFAHRVGPIAFDDDPG